MPATYNTPTPIPTQLTGFPIHFLLPFRAFAAPPPELKVASLSLDWLATSLAARILF